MSSKHAASVRRSRDANRKARVADLPTMAQLAESAGVSPVAKDHRPQVDVVLFHGYGVVYVDGQQIDTVTGGYESQQVNQLLHLIESRTNAIRVVTHEHLNLGTSL